MVLKKTKSSDCQILPIRKLAEAVESRLVETLLDDVGHVTWENRPPEGFGPVELISIRRSDCTRFDVPAEFLWNAQDRLLAIGEDRGDLPLLLDSRRDFLFDFHPAVMRSSRLVYELYGALKTNFPKKKFADENGDLIASVFQLLPYCGDDSFIPLMKYQLSYLFAKGERQEELPVRPASLLLKDGQILAGDLGKVFSYKCFGTSRQSMIWKNTVLHGIKKGLDQMGPESIRKNLLGVVSRLTRRSETPLDLLAVVRHVTREVFKKKIYREDWERVNLWTGVSSNSCYEMTRSQKGAAGLLFYNACSRGFDLWGNSYSFDGSSFSLGFPRLLTFSENIYQDSVQEWYAPSWVPADELEEARRDSWLTETARAKIKAILEPLKVRLISASDMDSNALWQRIQVLMWSRLQEFPQFQLTGKPVSLEIVHSIDNDLPFWISADYSAATDCMNVDATEAVVEEIAGDPETRQILMRGLTNNEISFQSIGEDYDINVPPDFRMTNGQLMGCVFSFPILCIVNASAYLYAHCLHFKKWLRVRDLPILLNGDDLLFKADDELYKTWCEIIAKVGFERFVGKNYKSRNMAVINSCLFHLPRFHHHRSWVVPYWNLGWMTGVKKGGVEDEDSGTCGIRAQQRDLENYFGGLGGKYRVPLLTFKRFVRDFRFLEVKRSHLPLDYGDLGLRLSFESTEVSDRFRCYSLSKGIKNQVPGSPLCPKTMAVWKFQSVQTIVSPAEVEAQWKEFRASKWSERWVGSVKERALTNSKREISLGFLLDSERYTTFGKC
jgi:hypothetical protein